MIIGGPGSGKSTLARAMAVRLDLPVTHIDQFQYSAGWVEVDPLERDAKVRAVVAQSSWIIDGNYSSTAEDRIARADTLIWLDMPLWRRLWRVARRTLRYYGQSRPDLPEDCLERFSAEFIRYIIFSNNSQRRKAAARYQSMKKSARAFRLRSSREVHSFLAQLKRAPTQ